MISYFLLFLQQKFRIPDRAIYYILVFLKGLLSSYIVIVDTRKWIIKIAWIFPKHTVWIKEIIKDYMEIIYYRVCSVYEVLYTNQA